MCILSGILFGIVLALHVASFFAVYASFCVTLFLEHWIWHCLSGSSGFLSHRSSGRHWQAFYFWHFIRRSTWHSIWRCTCVQSGLSWHSIWHFFGLLLWGLSDIVFGSRSSILPWCIFLLICVLTWVLSRVLAIKSAVVPVRVLDMCLVYFDMFSSM